MAITGVFNNVDADVSSTLAGNGSGAVTGVNGWVSLLVLRPTPWWSEDAVFVDEQGHVVADSTRVAESSGVAELDSAASTFVKAQRLAASQPGQELVAARAYEGIASVANYKKNFKEACTQIAEAAKIYQSKSAGQPLIERVNAIMDAAACQKPA